MIDVEVIAGAGTIVIIVPAGWAVNDDRLGKSMGTKSIKVVPHTGARPAAAGPAAAASAWASLKVRSAEQARGAPSSRRELARRHGSSCRIAGWLFTCWAAALP